MEVLRSALTRAVMLGRVDLLPVLSAVLESVVLALVDSEHMVQHVELPMGSVILPSIVQESPMNVQLTNTKLIVHLATIMADTVTLGRVQLTMSSAV